MLHQDKSCYLYLRTRATHVSGLNREQGQGWRIWRGTITVVAVAECRAHRPRAKKEHAEDGIHQEPVRRLPLRLGKGALPVFGAGILGFAGILTEQGPFSPAVALIPGRAGKGSAQTSSEYCFPRSWT
jgi:hypothetical protein